MEEDINEENGKQDKNKLKSKIKKQTMGRNSPNQNKSTKRKAEALDDTSNFEKISFAREIQHMMHAFGDVSRTRAESAELIESIILQQLHSVLIQACDTAIARNAKQIMAEDLIFLMRKDHVKLSRLINYFSVKEIKKSYEDDEIENDIINDVSANKKSKLNLILKFLDELDPTGRLLFQLEGDIYDEVKMERLQRAERQTRFMNEDQYMKYHKARTVSFRKIFGKKRFEEWMMRDVDLELKPNEFAQDILHYLAYETVNQIVDLALIVIQESGQYRQRMNVDFPAYNENSPSSSPGPSSSPKAKRQKRDEDKSDISMRAIAPEDIQEAIDRYFKETGPIFMFSIIHNSTKNKRLLTC